MSRVGKIARLPHHLREEINQRIHNGEKARETVEWINSLPEAQAILAAQFKGRAVNEPNLTHWKAGGYRDWLLQQDAMDAVRRFGQDAAELKKASGGDFGDQLSVCLVARISMAMRQAISNTNDPVAQLKVLRLLCRDVAALRRGDHNAEWLKIERERLGRKKGKHV